MSGKVFVEVVRGGKRGLQPLDDPPAGKGYIVVPIENQLIDKINTLDHNGHWERELSEKLGAFIEHFFRTRPIAIATPARELRSLGLYDHRDPLKERIN